jgi:2-methylisocitrate lyase-like PEP mutase family enzyme
VSATPLPVSADLENCFADDAEGVAQTIELALGAGLAGCSVEDYGGDGPAIYDLALAKERVAAAAEVAHGGGVHLVLTGRAENFIRGNPDLADTIERLQAYQEAGADVLYAPGLGTAEEIRQVVSSVDRPVNVLARAGAPTVSELAELGVARISVGGHFAFAAIAGLVEAATELRDRGTYGFAEASRNGGRAAREAFD